MPHHHSGEHHSGERSSSEEGSWEHSGEKGDHDGFWKGCSRRWWGDDDHEEEAKKRALVISLIVVFIMVIIITIVVVVCCMRRKRRLIAARRNGYTTQRDEKQPVPAPVEIDPAKHPKALEAYGPGGVPSVVVVAATAPGKEGSLPKDPRLTLGVWSPPPEYNEKPKEENKYETVQ